MLRAAQQYTRTRGTEVSSSVMTLRTCLHGGTVRSGWSRGYASFKAAEPLDLSAVNKRTIDAKYAVRGKIPIRADELNDILKSDTTHQLPFSKIINANIGNPQQLDQKPLTWYRQVLSLLQYPELLESGKDLFPKDVLARGQELISHLGSIGAYSHSQGDGFIRERVAEFITKRDGYKSNASDIFLTGGASAAVQYLIQLLSEGEKTGFLIPIPQYPLYTATIALNNAVPVGYFLEEENDWSTNPEGIRNLIKENQAKGVNIKALVVINPGNPTGSILTKENIAEIIDIAAEHGLVLIADEVYQENVFKGEFLSVKKVLSELKEKDHETYNNVQLASLHSTSKGVSGECGQRGGYMEVVGFRPEVKDIIFKLASINLCSVVSGQALMELMINPPKPNSPSYDTFKIETSRIHDDLQSRATFLHECFEQMEDVSCNKPMGAMYLFPRLDFAKDVYPSLFELSKKEGLQLDEIYCIRLLEETGICCVPGSGFGQKPDTYHLRTTFLPPGKEWISKWAKFHAKFVSEFKST